MNTPGSMVLLGFVLALGAGIIYAVGSADGLGWLQIIAYIVMIIAGVVSSVGVISAGVRHGTTWVDYDRYERHGG